MDAKKRQRIEARGWRVGTAQGFLDPSDAAAGLVLGEPQVTTAQSDDLAAGASSVAEVEPLGAKIRRLRTQSGLGQDRLAIEARVDQSGLSKLERGKGRRVGEASLRRIATVLRVSFEDLIVSTDYHGQR